MKSLLEIFKSKKEVEKERDVFIITKKFRFDAAHYLPLYDGKCSDIHGHTFYVEVSIIGSMNNHTGMVIDFKDVKDIVKRKIIDELDHKYLNNFIYNPTAEVIAQWIWLNLQEELDLYKIKVYETPDSCCTLMKTMI